MKTVLLVGGPFCPAFLAGFGEEYEIVMADTAVVESAIPAGNVPVAIIAKNLPESEKEAVHRLVLRWPKAARVGIGPIEPWLETLGFERFDEPTAHSQIKWAIFWEATAYYLFV